MFSVKNEIIADIPELLVDERQSPLDIIPMLSHVNLDLPCANCRRILITGGSKGCRDCLRFRKFRYSDMGNNNKGELRKLSEASGKTISSTGIVGARSVQTYFKRLHLVHGTQRRGIRFIERLDGKTRGLEKSRDTASSLQRVYSSYEVLFPSFCALHDILCSLTNLCS